MAGKIGGFVGASVPRHWQRYFPHTGLQGPPGGYQYLYAMATAILYLWVIYLDMKPTRKGSQKKTPTGVPKGHETNV